MVIKYIIAVDTTEKEIDEFIESMIWNNLNLLLDFLKQCPN